MLAPGKLVLYLCDCASHSANDADHHGTVTLYSPTSARGAPHIATWSVGNTASYIYCTGCPLNWTRGKVLSESCSLIFSSAFETVQPLRLGDKLLQMGVDAHLVSWITNYATERPQFIRLKDCLSDTCGQ